MNTLSSIFFFFFLALIIGTALGQFQCVDYTIENNLILVTDNTIEAGFQSDPSKCLRAQNEFWNQYGGKNAVCWQKFVEDGWDCMEAVAVLTGSFSCPACKDGVPRGVCNSACTRVINKCPKTMEYGKCFTNEGVPVCFGGDSACTKWAVDETVLETQTGLSPSDDNNAATNNLIGVGVSFIVATLLLAAGFA